MKAASVLKGTSGALLIDCSTWVRSPWTSGPAATRSKRSSRERSSEWTRRSPSRLSFYCCTCAMRQPVKKWRTQCGGDRGLRKQTTRLTSTESSSPSSSHHVSSIPTKKRARWETSTSWFGLRRAFRQTSSQTSCGWKCLGTMNCSVHRPTVSLKAGSKLSFALGDLGPSLGFDGDRCREWRRETVQTLQEVNIFWGDTRETKLATLRCVRA